MLSIISQRRNKNLTTDIYNNFVELVNDLLAESHSVKVLQNESETTIFFHQRHLKLLITIAEVNSTVKVVFGEYEPAWLRFPRISTFNDKNLLVKTEYQFDSVSVSKINHQIIKIPTLFGHQIKEINGVLAGEQRSYVSYVPKVIAENFNECYSYIDLYISGKI